MKRSGIGTDSRAAIGKIVDAALQDERHAGKSGVEADAVLLKAAHHAVGRREPKGASARKNFPAAFCAG